MAMFFETKSSSSSSGVGYSYDVFLSFRGEDTRKNFTDHLYSALVQAGIRAFRDDNELPRGEEIAPKLLKAIEESRISIVVFSKGYASSTWCLDELMHIMECKNRRGQIVLPIFYNIDPTSVRKQKRSFAEAFEMHEELFKEEMEKVIRWRKALKEAANLSGYPLKDMANGHESAFIRNIVQDVLNKLNRKYLHVSKHLLGIDSCVDNMIAWLRDFTNDVPIVGIHGMPGIGKTTIAKVVFNQLYNGFEGSCFLKNVAAKSQPPSGLVQLQEQLLCEILKQDSLKINNEDRGINLIKERLCHKRVLVVLDDVEKQEQLDALVGEGSFFGTGSVIIITTRNENFLSRFKVVVKYQAELLNEDESLQLFSWHAFNNNCPPKDYVELSKVVVDYCGRLPLALEVLGSILFKKEKIRWEGFIDKLTRIPNATVHEKLRICFDELDDDKLQNTFLDIVCFFIGREKEYVAKILEGCYGYNPEDDMGTLVERSLITINNFGEINMHDLLRDMGREIIRQKSPHHPGKRSRIWHHEDAWNVLNNQMGTKAVNGLVLDVRASEVKSLNTESFRKMKHLKLLQINGVSLTGSFKLLSKELIWLCWLECPLKSFSSDFTLDNLAVLDMQYSSIKELWREKKILNKLKILNLSYSKHLVETPNLHSSSLEKLMFEGCSSLVEVHQSIGHLKGLVLLNLKGCWRLKHLPESICGVKSLQILNISGCLQLEKLPEPIGNTESLTELVADGIENQQFFSSVGHLKHVRKLSLCGYNFNQESSSSTSWLSPILSWLSPRGLNLKALLPTSFTDWRLLKELKLGYCGLFEGATYCVDFGRLSSLIELDLSGNKFTNLPAGIGSLPKLWVLEVQNCRNLLSISELPSNLTTLDADNCTSMERVRLPTQSETAPTLYLNGCQNLIEIQGTEGVSNWFNIFSQSCYNLSNNYKRSLVEAFCNCDYDYVIQFSGGEMPHWFSYRGERGSSTLSFRLPPVFEALIIWVVYESSPGVPKGWVIIRNKGNGKNLTLCEIKEV